MRYLRVEIPCWDQRGRSAGHGLALGAWYLGSAHSDSSVDRQGLASTPGRPEGRLAVAVRLGTLPLCLLLWGSSWKPGAGSRFSRASLSSVAQAGSPPALAAGPAAPARRGPVSRRHPQRQAGAPLRWRRDPCFVGF